MLSVEQFAKGRQVRRVIAQTLESGYVLTAKDIEADFLKAGLSRSTARGLTTMGFRDSTFGKDYGVPVKRVELTKRNRLTWGYYDSRLDLRVDTDFELVERRLLEND